jgi:hypothetical protein
VPATAIGPMLDPDGAVRLLRKIERAIPKGPPRRR